VQVKANNLKAGVTKRKKRQKVHRQVITSEQKQGGLEGKIGQRTVNTRLRLSVNGIAN